MGDEQAIREQLHRKLVPDQPAEIKLSVRPGEGDTGELALSVCVGGEVYECSAEYRDAAEYDRLSAQMLEQARRRAGDPEDSKGVG